MASLNPMYYLKHAWEATHSFWGKACIVLYYLFVWLQIIWAIELVIAPTAGWECFYEGISEYSFAWLTTSTRAMNVLTIGFYLYADRGGIKVWNVAMVFVFNAAWTWAIIRGLSNIWELEGAPEGCEAVGKCLNTSMWVLFWWSVLAMICSLMEKRSAPSGTGGETAPLV